MECRLNTTKRTMAGLAAAKARGVELGNLRAAAMKGTAAKREAADGFAANTLPVVRQMQAEGITSLVRLARELNSRGIPTARGSTWYPSTVWRLLKRGGQD